MVGITRSKVISSQTHVIDSINTITTYRFHKYRILNQSHPRKCQLLWIIYITYTYIILNEGNANLRVESSMNSLVMKLFICLLGLALASFRSDRLLVGGQLSRLIRRLGIIIHPAVSLLHQACKTGDVVSCTKPILMESKSNAPRSIAGPVIVSSDPHPRF